ncbi:MAG: hypothetical protein KJ600_05165 [Nanoarchaeota archaeon]|nr:hypothetical protein [Nanoarchaeota archaeon]
MKKMLLVFVGLVLFGIVSALPNPSTVYCEEMNYTSNETHCIFSENASCELWSFFNGSCGSEYVIELSCVEAGESLGPATECCGGLVGLDNFRIDETGECVGLIGGYLKCSDCGNGVCEDWENKCNCLDDCENVSCKKHGEVPKFTGLEDSMAVQCCEGLIHRTQKGQYDEDCVNLFEKYGGGGYVGICLACGDGVCDSEFESVCNCEEDCGGDSGKGFSSGWILLILAIVVFVIIGFKILKWLFWSLAILAIVLAIWFFVF